MSECPTVGVLMRGMVDRGRMGRGRVSILAYRAAS